MLLFMDFGLVCMGRRKLAEKSEYKKMRSIHEGTTQSCCRQKRQSGAVKSYGRNREVAVQIVRAALVSTERLT